MKTANTSSTSWLRVRVEDEAQVETVGGERPRHGLPGPEDGFQDGVGRGPAHAYDADAPHARGRGYGADGVVRLSSSFEHGRLTAFRRRARRWDAGAMITFFVWPSPSLWVVIAVVVLEERVDDPPLVRVQGLRPGGFPLFSHLVREPFRHGDDRLLSPLPEAVHVEEQLQVLLVALCYGELHEVLERLETSPSCPVRPLRPETLWRRRPFHRRFSTRPAERCRRNPRPP